MSTLLRTDRVTLVATAIGEGKIRLTCAAWEEARVILPGEWAELRWVHAVSQKSGT